MPPTSDPTAGLKYPGHQAEGGPNLRGRDISHVIHVPFASVFQKPSPGFAYAFIRGAAKMEQITNKLQTNTGKEGANL